MQLVLVVELLSAEEQQLRMRCNVSYSVCCSAAASRLLFHYFRIIKGVANQTVMPQPQDCAVLKRSCDTFWKDKSWNRAEKNSFRPHRDLFLGGKIGRERKIFFKKHEILSISYTSPVATPLHSADWEKTQQHRSPELAGAFVTSPWHQFRHQFRGSSYGNGPG